MPVNGFTVGTDTVVTLISPLGAVLKFSKITGYTSKEINHDFNVNGLDGSANYGHQNRGYEGTITVERASSAVEDFFCTRNLAELNGTNIGSGSIVRTITENDGSVSQYTDTGVDFVLNNGGDFQGVGTVKMELGWKSGCRKKTA